jgi:hypothetical protein
VPYAPLDHAIDCEGQKCRQQQQHRHHRADREVLLADHLLVDVDRQHVGVAADDLGHAEFADRHREHDQRGRDQAVLGARQRDREELAHLAGAHRLGRLVKARVRQRQRSHQDHHRVRHAGETHRHHHARHAVDLLEAEPAEHEVQPALVAEQVQERQRRQQRRREDRDQRDVAPQTAPRQAGTLHRERKAEGQRHRDQRGQQREGQRVGNRGRETRARQIGGKVGEADELAAAAIEAAQQDGRQRHGEEHEQRDRQQQHAAARGDCFARQRPARYRRLRSVRMWIGQRSAHCNG